ncbi:MAG: NAD-glutamate dehydrogenase, partial [Rhodospirillaceae bacterium]|nr:NAD-glutamate dehydrogenase [Rhodospirillaceae bacterium]
MAAQGEQRKADLVERLSAQARAGGAGPGPAAATLAVERARFVRLFLANIPPEDLLRETPENLLGAALALWAFGAVRTPGRAKLRLYNPEPERDGWRCSHSVVEVVNDDMPFLVDSVSMALNRLGLHVHLVIHPIVRVARDAGGRVTAEAAGAAVREESWMALRIDRVGGEARMAEIAAGLEEVLADVRVATQDWRAMLQRVEEVVADLDARPPPLPAQEIEEAKEFLRWLTRDNFTFLGYREYELGDGDGQQRLAIRPERGLGLLRDEGRSVFDGLRHFDRLPEDTRLFMQQQRLLMVTKANLASTVHRPSLMDVIGVKRLDAEGRFRGERLFAGLFTSPVYVRSPLDIPLLRRKVAGCLARAGLPPASHDAKALAHILETYPREELFQISEDELFETAMGILHLQERQRVALFVRRDPFERHVSCLVYLPRDRYSSQLRRRFETLLAEAWQGRVESFVVQVGDAPLARVLALVATRPGALPAVDLAALEARLADAARSWSDLLQQALVEARGEEAGLAAMRRFGGAFPAGYQEQFDPRAAVFDIAGLEQALAGGGLMLDLYRPRGAPPQALRLKLYSAGERPIALSDVLPVLEHAGLKVLSESPYAIRPADAERPLWIHDLDTVSEDGAPIDLERVRGPFREAMLRIWSGEVEDDGFNRLVLRAGLDWREVALLRALAKYLRQIGAPWGQAYMEEALARHAGIASLLVALFAARFDPALPRSESARRAQALEGEIERALEAVTTLDEDRILRRFLNLVRATLRTNHFQPGRDGGPKPYLSLKLNSHAVDEMPQPRPLYEIFVYSPRVEAVHLRGGKVARGGIRWSDRRDDFRTEVLGLMKAQMVKNAVIVPVGSKGGFVVKRPPAGDRAALQAEVVACYQTMMRGMLDLTDTIDGDAVVPPAGLVRYDDDDPYLVVAADKGTASFSDVANAVAAEYGFWLGDAFASGGSAGYDHKKMGITARGAWEAVKRHFRELGVDVQTQDFTVVGVGDMSGDVFGNGMLRSRHIRLVGAFNHQHIFVDPDPDPARSYAERERLFNLPRSSWADYDRNVISPGGGVFERSAKSIPLSPEMRRALAVQAETMTPAELIRALLRAPVDLLYLGGIGTYVKATGESHAEVGDRANDALRVNARELRCRVVAEGANLGFTQRGRVEAALAGRRLNTDAVDNSAGVDCSDHEVNLKILLAEPARAGTLTRDERNKLLADMAEEVAALVLRDNYLQTQAISVTEARAPLLIDQHGRFMRALEKAGALDRALEALPDDEALERRLAARRGLTRPEIAVLLAYAKTTLYAELLPSDLPDDPALEEDLAGYFPAAVRTRFADAIRRHRLRREIIATVVTNDIVNRMGPTFVHVMREWTGAPAATIARAYFVARAAFDLPALWAEIEALDGTVPAALQIEMLHEAAQATETAVLWLLRHVPAPLDIAATLARFGPGIARLAGLLPEVSGEDDRAGMTDRAARFAAAGAPEALARRLALLRPVAADLDVVGIAVTLHRPVESV